MTDMTMMMMILVMKMTMTLVMKMMIMMMTLVIKMTIMATKIMKGGRVGGKVECMLGDTMEVTAMTRLRDVAGWSSEGSPENFILQRLNVSIAMGSRQIGAQLSGTQICPEHHILMMVIACVKRNWRTLLIAVCFGTTKRSFGIWFWPERGNLVLT